MNVKNTTIGLSTALLITAGLLLLWPFESQSAPPFIDAQASRLKADVIKLTNLSKPRSAAHPEAMNEAVAYIASEWNALGFEVEYQAYTVNGIEYKNVLTSIGPKDAERIVIGAHYDVCGNQPGADDNASGVAGLLELARLYQQNAPKLNYRIDFVAYALEEPPNFRTENMGSAVHARSLKEAGVKVKQMICLEMIGYFSDAEDSQDYPVGLLKWFYPTKGNYIAVIGKLGQIGATEKFKKDMRKGTTLPVVSLSAPKFIPGVDFSDHLNYWKHGFKALMITDTAFYRNKNYHKGTDRPETLNYEKMAEVVKGVYWSLQLMNA